MRLGRRVPGFTGSARRRGCRQNKVEINKSAVYLFSRRELTTVGLVSRRRFIFVIISTTLASHESIQLLRQLSKQVKVCSISLLAGFPTGLCVAPPPPSLSLLHNHLCIYSYLAVYWRWYCDIYLYISALCLILFFLFITTAYIDTS